MRPRCCSCCCCCPAAAVLLPLLPLLSCCCCPAAAATALAAAGAIAAAALTAATELLLLPLLLLPLLSRRHRICCRCSCCRCCRRTGPPSSMLTRPAHPNSGPPACSGQQHVVGHPGQPAACPLLPASDPGVLLRPPAQLCGHFLQRPSRRRLCNLAEGLPAALPPFPRLVHQGHAVARGAAAPRRHAAANRSIHSHAAHPTCAPGPARSAVAGGSWQQVRQPA